jgi:hypothetical protein
MLPETLKTEILTPEPLKTFPDEAVLIRRQALDCHSYSSVCGQIHAKLLACRKDILRLCLYFRLYAVFLALTCCCATTGV